MAFDFKKEFKEFYVPAAKPAIVEMPVMNSSGQFWDKYIRKTPLDALQWGFLVTPTEILCNHMQL